MSRSLSGAETLRTATAPASAASAQSGLDLSLGCRQQQSLLPATARSSPVVTSRSTQKGSAYIACIIWLLSFIRQSQAASWEGRASCGKLWSSRPHIASAVKGTRQIPGRCGGTEGQTLFLKEPGWTSENHSASVLQVFCKCSASIFEVKSSVNSKYKVAPWAPALLRKVWSRCSRPAKKVQQAGNMCLYIHIYIYNEITKNTCPTLHSSRGLVLQPTWQIEAFLCTGLLNFCARKPANSRLAPLEILWAVALPA